MSAAVSHELNQPLAAMKTYLAGAKLLLQRKRAEEALSSFQRIDDLIERMGAITRQLKSYARKGGEAFEELDMRDSISAALSHDGAATARAGAITRNMPREPVMVMGDRVRLEQVLINLLAQRARRHQGGGRCRRSISCSPPGDSGDGSRCATTARGSRISTTCSSPSTPPRPGRRRRARACDLLGHRERPRRPPDGAQRSEGGAVFEVQLPLLREEDASKDVEAAE
jgi:two-component system C4-dicarboxylate transport sensor histidine kinase DctB